MGKMNSEQLCEYFTQFILFVYSLIFRLITRVKKRSFTPYTDAFLDTISVQPEEWKLEGKQEKVRENKNIRSRVGSNHRPFG
eukprot:PDM74891.1 hypothetical protein PRIPAC_40272 [Pristionchus pacificus]